MKVLIFFRNLVVLLIVFLSLSSFDNKKNNDKIFKHLSKLYQNDKHRCLEKASKMINRDHKNYIAYIYVLKCELDDSIFNKIDAYSHKLSNKKEAKFLVKKVRKLVRYAKIIEKNLDDEIKCKSGYFVDAKSLVKIIRNTGMVVIEFFPDSKESYVKHCKKICDFSTLCKDGSSYSVKTIYGKTRFTVDTSFYLNGLPTGQENIQPSSLEEEMSFLRIINRSRKDKGLHPLKICKDLSRAARYHSYDMATQNYFSHTSYDRDGKCGNLEKVGSFSDRCRKFKGASLLGENIAAGNYSAQATFKQWYTSPGHYKNMFHERYTYIGIGMIKVPNSTHTYYWTTDFR